MKFSQLAFIVTDDCNFNCSYCPQIKEKNYIKKSTIDKAVAFFYPFLEKEAYILFCGGEPLLAFDTIKYAVSLLQEIDRDEGKKIQFSITTNGSLLTDEMLHFFDTHHFDIMLSFDGLAQESGRKPSSLAPIQKLIKRLQKKSYPGIEFSTNSVFTPGTVNQLSASMQYIIDLGVTDSRFDFTRNISWGEAALLKLEKELAALSGLLVAYYKENGTIPMRNFRRTASHQKSEKRRTCFTCAGGYRRMAISPEEDVWGCYIFHDYFKSRQEDSDFHSYRFGKLDDFINNHESIYPQILPNYAYLRQDFFFIENQDCFLCDEIENCGVCPVSAAYATSFIGKISPWVCHIEEMQRRAQGDFLNEIDRIEVLT